MKRLSVATLAFACFSAHGAVPVIFQAGQPAKAAEVNQNFQYLDQKPGASVSVNGFTNNSDTGVTSAQCPNSSTVTGVGCTCDTVNGTKNIGILGGCSIAGNGGVAACFLETATYNPNKAVPRAVIVIQCLSSSGATPSAASKSSLTSDPSRDIEEALESARTRAAAVESVLRQK